LGGICSQRQMDNHKAHNDVDRDAWIELETLDLNLTYPQTDVEEIST